MSKSRILFGSPVRRAIGLTSGIVGLSAALVLYTSSAEASPKTRPAPRFTAVQLANGILFSDGPAAPFASGHTSFLTSRQRTIENLVDARIAANPATASTAAAQLQSGDRLQVRSGLLAIGTIYKQVLDEEDGAQNVTSAVNALAGQHGISATAVNGATADSVSPDRLLWTYSASVTDEYEVSYAAVDLALELAALVAVLLVLVVPLATPAGALAADQLVNRLSTNLATA